MIGQTISHYRILEKLGEGGMGVVYKAEDTRLDRLVAIKLLPPHQSADPVGRQRFVREAKAAAALLHPNVCPVYEIDELDGRTFIVMAFLDGTELSAEIAAGPLKVEDLVEKTIQITQGLREAHSKGMAHRDVKPANIMIAGSGQAVLMDFGLAQLSTASKLTQEGTSMGTAAYMSPEQTSGDEVDHRTDLWAVGVVLYEMATGQLPFTGHYRQAVLYSILNTDPQPITGLRTGLPMQLEHIVHKCLAKRVDERYQSTDDLLAELRALKRTMESGAEPRRTLSTDRRTTFAADRGTTFVEGRRTTFGEHDPRPSVAVLPFENRSRDEDDEYLSDGIAEDIINALTKVQGLRVAARSSAFHFKGKNTPLDEVGEKLHVVAVVEGTVRRAGQRLRISAQLVDVLEGYQIWSERYDRVIEDIFDVQDEISLAIVEQLKVKLIGNERLVEKPTSNEEAYQLYLRGRHLTYRLTGDSVQKGLDFLQRARELDPAFVQAYATESMGYAVLTGLGWMSPAEGWKRARTLAMKAIDMDDRLAEAHMSRGLAAMFADWDWLQAEAALRRAVALNPEDPNTHSWLAELLIPIGRFDEALAEARRARELDPLSVEANRKTAMGQFFSHDYEGCIESCLRVLDLDPQHALGHWYLGIAQCCIGSLDDALETLHKACSSLSYDPLLHSAFGYALARAGRPDEARRILAELRARQEKGFPCSWLIGFVHLGLGENGAALDALEDCVEQREGLAVYTNSFQWPATIRSDPRFQDLLRRMNFPAL